MPIISATRRAPSSSPFASDAETAVIATARFPSPRCAAAATTEESTPPENATTAPPVEAARPASCVSVAFGSIGLPVSIGGGERGCPHLLDGAAGLGGDGGAVVVFGRDVDDAAIQQPELHAHAVAEHVDLAHLAFELVPVQPRHPNAERRAVFEQRGSDRHLGLGARERAQDHARAALLHRDRRGPDIDRAGLACTFG